MGRGTAPRRVRLLIVDDDARYREWLCHHLGALLPESLVSALDRDDFVRLRDCLSDRECDVLLLGASFGTGPEDEQADGLALLRSLRARPRVPAIILLAEQGNELTAVRAVQLGAADYLPKRLLNPQRLDTAVQIALRRLERRAARALSQPDATAVPADFVPGYTIRACIGESERATVHVAASHRLGHDVAIKIGKSTPDDSLDRQLLEREYSAIAAIRAPCIVRLFDYGLKAGREYLVMEYLPRGDLKSRMQAPLTERQALAFAERIAASLQVVHDAGLVHRDLKPPNVMLRDDDEVALIDFGLARALDGSTPLTCAGVLRGSPYYMSPEQALGEALDARSDFYSLGIVLYEMLTGRKPYTGSSPLEVLQQHVNASLPELPRALAHYAPLLAKLLAKRREARFSRAAEIRAAIALLAESDTQPDQASAA